MKKTNITPIILFHCVTPLLIGFIIYVLFRDKNIQLFIFFERIGGFYFINNIREHTLPFSEYIPKLILYNLPDAIWVYSFSIIMGIIWYRTRYFIFWLSIGFVLGFSSELCQLFNIIEGTFCTVNLLFNIFAFVFAYKYFSNNRRSHRYEF